MLVANDLSFAYNGGAVITYPHLEATVHAPLLIRGRSGSGKTTLLHLLAGLLRPRSGAVHIAGTNLDSLSSQALDRFRGQHVGIVFQRAHFMPSLTVADNILLASYFSGRPLEQARVQHLAERLGIGHLLPKRPHELSQGEQQRVSVARALVNGPAVLLADEPTSSLDDVNCMSVLQLLQEQAQWSKAALVVVTHDARLMPHFTNQITLS
ncbi:MAG TPA: ATP-binding cassette domain-containing protein [Chitinophaga sp.]